MRLPLSWLNEYVKVDDVPVETLKNSLFSCGFEVEEIIQINENVKNIVVCQINAIEQHPNADKLSVCDINCGKYGCLQIVTNAKNIKVGDKVPVSLDGAVLADGTVIKKGKLRGVESDGMFCGGAEIGITEEYYDGAGEDSVLVFKDDFPVGADVCELLNIRDTVFDVSITANRPDCQSILGLAREIAAMLKRELKYPAFDYVVENEDEQAPVLVEVKNTTLCPRYIAQYVKDLTIRPSPKWMQRRLALMGLRAINNIVDITNYVLLEMGQPMHAFDYDKLLDKKIVVRNAEKGEKITTLDDKTFDLNPDNLVICDGERPVALAGIMGGKESGIDDYTLNLVFECARFKRDSVRKTSKALGQHSDSSARFEKGVDSYTVEKAMNRALHLINELNAGTVACKRIDVLNDDMTPLELTAKFSSIDKILGINVPKDEQINILKRLEFDVKQIDDDTFKVIVPLYRNDIEGFADLSEEIIRSYGYEHVKGRMLECASVTNGGKTPRQLREDKVKNALVYMGYNEILTYSFVSESDYANFGLNKDAPENMHIKILNPLSEDMSVMRTTLIPSIVATVNRNLNKKNLEGRLFEYAKVYLPHSLPLTELPAENARIAIAAFGDNEDFFTLKGTIDSLLDVLHFGKPYEYAKVTLPYMHDGKSAEIVCDGKRLGVLGELHPALYEKLGIDKRVYVAELDYDLIDSMISGRVYFAPISKFPSVERDLALVCDEDTPNALIEKLIRERGGKNLQSVELFDVYKGKGIDDGKKSMAYRLTFSSLEKTFGEGEVDAFIKKILRHLDENGIKLR